MPFEIMHNDITKLTVDAIVNDANSELQRGAGVCGAIFAAAGYDKLQRACDEIGGCKTGQAVITKAYAMPAKYIIHTVGPVWYGGDRGERELLYDCYRNCLELAKENKLKSVAFPLISSGIYGYPKDKALRVATEAIGNFLLENDMAVSLVLFDKESYTLSEELYFSIKSFIDNNYDESKQMINAETLSEISLDTMSIDEVPVSEAYEEIMSDAMPVCEAAELLKCVSAPFSDTKDKKTYASVSRMEPRIQEQSQRSLDDIISNMDETFSQRLLRLIDEKERNDAEVYKRANIDRRVFSKIRSNKDYRPSKNTALAFAIALELSLDETHDLLMRAGFALSRSNKLDVIVEYFINEKIYNIFEINEALFAFDQSLLGA